MIEYLLFAIGFLILVKGAGILIDGAVALARRMRASDALIGVTVLAFGTSIPELFVGIVSGIRQESAIGVGNVLGSNIANIFLVFGLAIVIMPITIKRSEVKFDVFVSLASVLLLAALVNFVSRGMIIGLFEGLILVLAFAAYFYYIIFYSKKNVIEQTNEMKTWKACCLVILGLVGVILGAEWVVGGASSIMMALGVSGSVIGLSVVALGTSLPELAASVVAIKKSKPEMAFGNIIGSNIFNILWVLGITSLITPLKFEVMNNWDMFVMLISTVLLMVFLFSDKKQRFKRWQGLLFLVLYAAYILFIFIR